MRNTVLAIAIGVACLVVAFVLGRAPAPPAAEPGGPPAEAVPETPVEPIPETEPPEEPGAPSQEPVEPGPPAASLEGTTPDGALVADASGRFVPSPSALRLFDYYLSASGEAPRTDLVARIEAEIASQLPPSAQAAAHELLDRFLAYREAARDLHADGLGTDDLETRHQRLRELRREHFGPDAEALFAEEEQLARVALAMREVERNPALSADEKRAHREALEESLPESFRVARREATRPLELQRRERALREAGASAGDVRALREEWVGTDAADRLEALDARRAAWQERVAAYRLERDLALEGAPGDDASERLEALRAQHFQGPDLVRIRALDRIDDDAAR